MKTKLFINFGLKIAEKGDKLNKIFNKPLKNISFWNIPMQSKSSINHLASIQKEKKIQD